MVSLGKLQTTVNIEKVGTAVDSAGVVAPTYTHVAERKAHVRGMSGRELLQAQQVASDVTHKVTMHYFAGLTTEHRLKIGTRVLNIMSVIDVEERGRVTELMCKEAV